MMVNILRFRPVVPEDRPLLNQLMRAGKGYWGYPEDGLDRFMKTFGIPDDTYFNDAIGFVAESSQDVVGYYLFKTDEQPPTLDQFFLDIRFVGQGYGRHLWNHCVGQSRQYGWIEFKFWSDPHSLGFYEHMGAVKIGERPMVTLPGHMAPIMQFSVPKKDHTR